MGVTRGFFDFWGKVINTLAGLMGVQLPMEPAVHLLNDDSHLSLTEIACRVWLAGLTAAKKIIVRDGGLFTGFGPFWTFFTWNYHQQVFNDKEPNVVVLHPS